MTKCCIMCVVKDHIFKDSIEELNFTTLTCIFGYTPCYNPSCRCHWYEDPIYGGKDIAKEINSD